MTALAAGRAPSRLGHHPSLDGLRAVSVMAVLLYHADLAWMPGGFLGVEVFFVVSGFLITSLLIDERHHTGTVSLRNFWIRRGRRLLPALYTLLLVVPAFMLVFWRDAAGRMLGDVAAALLYVSNWWQIFLSESYFAQAGRPPVLRHLWSLAIEEQFYILFPPLLLFLLSRLGRDRTRNVLVGLAVASAVWMAILFEPMTDPSRVYYGTDTRASGLLLGAVLALVWSPWRTHTGMAAKAAGPTLDTVGVLCLLALAWFFHRVNAFDPFVYRGGFFLLDLVVVALIAVLVHPAAKLSRVLGVAPLVWIGVRSYSIYLWHWPIFMVTRPQLDVPLTGVPLFVLRMVLTFGAAMASYRYIEQPIRDGALGRFRDRVRSSSGEQRIRLQQTAYLSIGGVAAAVILVTAGMLSAARSDEREALELEVASADVVEAAEVPEAPAPTPQSSSGADPTEAPTEVMGATTVPAAVGTTPTDAVAVGDSVMLGASSAMKAAMPGIRVDAKVARQADQLTSAALWYHTSGNAPGPLVVQLGNNGIVEPEAIDRLVEGVDGAPVLLVNTKVPRPWESLANERTAAAAERHDNAVLVDWYSLASEHPEWFVSDGTHLRPEGQRAYAELVRSHLPGS